VLALDVVGLGFVAYYRSHPALSASLSNPDQILPHFVTHVLPSPLPGLVIAGILAATMSTLSSGLNSLCTVTMVDFYRRFVPIGNGDPAADVRKARWCTLGWGLLLTFAATFMNRLGPIMVGSMKALGFLSGPLLGMFLLGVLSKRPNGFGVLIGAAVGTACAAYVAARTPVSWLWYGPAGCLATMVVGFALSYLRPSPRAEAVERLTVWGGDGGETPAVVPTTESA
jgi:Na+/proline symporter